MKKPKKQPKTIFHLAINFFDGEDFQVYRFEPEGLLNFLLSFEMDCPNKEDFKFALSEEGFLNE